MDSNPLHLRPAAYCYPAKDFVACVNAGDTRARALLTAVFKRGVTKSLVKEINSGLESVRTGVYVRANPNTGTLETHHVWLMDAPPTGDQGLILAFVEFIKSGALQKLKVCDADDCNNYHFRRGKWCSNKCGSRQRVRKKRKLDMQRQML